MSNMHKVMHGNSSELQKQICNPINQNNTNAYLKQDLMAGRQICKKQKKKRQAAHVAVLPHRASIDVTTQGTLRLHGMIDLLMVTCVLRAGYL
jgi:hypothetical protein